MVESKLIAVKDGQRRQFSRKQWDLLGTDKYGWELVPEVPKEVVHVAKAVISGEPPITIIGQIKPMDEPTPKPTTKKTRKPRKK